VVYDGQGSNEGWRHHNKNTEMRTTGAQMYLLIARIDSGPGQWITPETQASCAVLCLSSGWRTKER
jgi:hypothetical protein